MKKLLILLTLLLTATGCTLSKPNSVSKWKIYESKSSTEFGSLTNPFTFRYPPDWSVVSEERGNMELVSFKSDRSYGSSPLPAGQFQIEIVPEWAQGNNEDIGDWCRKQLTAYRYNEYSEPTILSEYGLLVGGFPAYAIDSQVNGNDPEWTDRQVCIAKGDTKMGIIGRPLNPQYLPLFDKILATFQFGK